MRPSVSPPFFSRAVLTTQSMLASLPAKDPDPRTDNSDTAPDQMWRDPQNKTRSVARQICRKWTTAQYQVADALDGRNPQLLTRPVQYLEVFQKQVKDRLVTIAQGHHHSPWVIACKDAYQELYKWRKPWGPKSKETDWAPFRFKIPPFELDERLTNFPPPLWAPKTVGPQPLPTPAESFLLPTEIAEGGLILVKAANPQGWSCYQIPKGKEAEVEAVWEKTPYGKALPDNRPYDKTVENLRAQVRRSRPCGTPIPWYRLAEVRHHSS